MAWFAFTNSKTAVGSNWSPEQTRPRLLPKSPALRVIGDSPAAADEAPPAQTSSNRLRDDLHLPRSGEPSCGSPAPSARTHEPVPPAFDPLGRAPPSADETQGGRGLGVSASRTPFSIRIRCPLRRVNSTTVSGSLTTVSGSLTTVSGSFTTVSGSLTTVIGSLTAVSGPLTTVRRLLTMVSGPLTTVRSAEWRSFSPRGRGQDQEE
jgi:hypothetical protein